MSDAPSWPRFVTERGHEEEEGRVCLVRLVSRRWDQTDKKFDENNQTTRETQRENDEALTRPFQENS